jgi:hypothetical protein
LNSGLTQDELRNFSKSQLLEVSDQALQVYFFQSNDEKTNLLPKEQFRRFLEQFVSERTGSNVDTKVASFKTFQTSSGGDETKQPLLKKDGSISYGLTVHGSGEEEKPDEDDDNEEEHDEHASWSPKQKLYFACFLLLAGTGTHPLAIFLSLFDFRPSKTHE